MEVSKAEELITSLVNPYYDSQLWTKDSIVSLSTVLGRLLGVLHEKGLIDDRDISIILDASHLS